MGQVFLCQDTALQRLVAVKFIRGLAFHPQTRDRFWLEARAVARLSHPNIVSVYRLGEFDGHPYLVSEYIDGQSLEELALPLPWQRAAQIGLGIAQGLASAHQRGVLHRDIKPANIMLANESDVKLLDFGLAKLLDTFMPATESPSATPALPPTGTADLDLNLNLNLNLDLNRTAPGSILSPRLPPDNDSGLASLSDVRCSPLSETGAIMGTPFYMAPEAWRGEQASRQTDIYSLGSVLYKLVTGQTPFLAADMGTLRRKVLTEAVESLARRAPEVDPRFAALIERCIRRAPADRFASVDEICESLRTLVPGPLVQLETDAHPVGSPRRWVYGAAAGLLSCTLLVAAYQRFSQRLPRGMATIDGGTFLMGSSDAEIESAYLWCKAEVGNYQCQPQTYERESPQRQVTVSGFRLDRTEVTTADFAAWLTRQPRLQLENSRLVKQDGVLLVDIYPSFQPFYGLIYDAMTGQYLAANGLEHRPVTQVTWIAALRFCRAQNKRLPTEAEWEYAARGTPNRRFPWGFDPPKCDGVVLGRSPANACRSHNLGPRDVGTSWQDRTPDGIYDLAGNAMEWVMDRFLPTYPRCAAPCRDPVAGTADENEDTERVMRGADWGQPLAVGRSASRSRWSQRSALLNVGFRCAAPGGK